MKKILFLVLLFAPLFGSSQTTTKPIDGFLGIKFGSTKEEVIAAMKAHGGTVNTDVTGDDLAFDNINLGHRATSVCMIRFVDNKAYEADFIFNPADDDHAIEYYNTLVNDMNDIYGEGKGSKKFSYPYAAGDGHEVTALQTGGADFSTFWSSANDNAIKASIEKNDDSSLSIELIYQGRTLSAQAVQKEKAKDKGDY